MSGSNIIINTFQVLSGGLINTVYKVTNVTRSESLIVRVFTESTHILTYVKDVLFAMRAAERDGVGAAVYSSFGNGLVYQYQPGEILYPDKPEYRQIDFRK